ncbi:hypothetical protein RND71_026495 [Anisodus tanguticus]|uniref:Uncharacterized protein n=1 Tax=Anisodus tanguticus TaxID=243964 RepID=A0AAE1RMF0_9SOLA|nr:hypothetical protein RND71_026495 [Anisodus tanguticus]
MWVLLTILLRPLTPLKYLEPLIRDTRAYERLVALSMRYVRLPLSFKSIKSEELSLSKRNIASFTLLPISFLLRSKHIDPVWVTPPFSVSLVRALLTFYESSGRKDFMNGLKELGIVDLFFKDWDKSMSVDGVKTLPDVEFQKPARGSPLFCDSS